MLRAFEIVPGVGVPPIRLGMTPDEVRAVMGEPEGAAPLEGAPRAWDYLNSALLVNFDDDERVSFLEVANLPHSGAIYRGQAVFDLPMAEAARLVCGKEPENPYECTDFDAGVALSSTDLQRWDTIAVAAGGLFRPPQ